MTQTRKSPPRDPEQALQTAAPIDRHLDAPLFRALGEPTRLRLLACLAKCARPCTVGELARCCHVDLSVVSRHLAMLARAGALTAERRGREVLYRVRTTELSGALRGLADALDACVTPGAGDCCDGAC